MSQEEGRNTVAAVVDVDVADLTSWVVVAAASTRRCCFQEGAYSYAWTSPDEGASVGKAPVGVHCGTLGVVASYEVAAAPLVVVNTVGAAFELASALGSLRMPVAAIAGEAVPCKQVGVVACSHSPALMGHNVGHKGLLLAVPLYQ
jgi:hypothetical protein